MTVDQQNGGDGAEGAEQAQAGGGAGPAHTGEGAGLRYNTATGQPCPRSVRPDGSVAGDGACHECGLGPACPLLDPWGDEILS